MPAAQKPPGDVAGLPLGDRPLRAVPAPAQKRPFAVIDLAVHRPELVAEVAAVEDARWGARPGGQQAQLPAERGSVDAPEDLLVDDQQVQLRQQGVQTFEQGGCRVRVQLVEVAEVQAGLLLVLDDQLGVGVGVPAALLDQKPLGSQPPVFHEAAHLPPHGVRSGDPETLDPGGPQGLEIGRHVAGAAEAVALLGHWLRREAGLHGHLRGAGVDREVHVQAEVADHGEASGSHELQDVPDLAFRESRDGSVHLANSWASRAAHRQ